MQYEVGSRPASRRHKRAPPADPVPATTIVGYSADPTQKENWESDFTDIDEIAGPVSGVFAPWRSASVANISQLPILHTDETKNDSDDSASSSPSSSSSSEGDWDAVPDDDDGAASSAVDSDALSTTQKQVTSMFRTLLEAADPLAPRQSRSSHHSHGVPRKHQLLRQLHAEDSSPGIKIVVYPKPSILYLEHTDEGRASFRESVLEEWLSMLGFKPAPAYLLLPAPLATGTIEPPSPATLPSLSDWLLRCVEHVHAFYRHRPVRWAIDKCWEATVNVLTGLARTKFVLADFTPESASRPAFDRLYLILYEAAKSVPRHHMDTFSALIQSSVAAFPRYKGHLELLLLSAIAHTDATRLNRVLRNYIVVLNAHDAAETPLQVEVACEALASLHLYLNQYSPLNTSILTATWDIADDPNVQWLEFALNDCEITSDLLNVPAMSPIQLKQEARLWKICGSATFRMERLESLYSKLHGCTMLRAKCAFAMGHFALHEHNDTGLAERLLFECVYLLDRARPVLQSQVPLISELGTNALTAYGDILLSNNKYKYAVLAMEAAGAIYKLRKGEDWSILDRRLCDVCSENRDWERSLRFHQRVLIASKTQENVNEFVYLSQQVSKIYDELGDFTNAEKSLLDALQFLSQISLRSSNTPSPASTIAPSSIPMLTDRDAKSDDSPACVREAGTIGRYVTRNYNSSIHRSGSRSVGRRSELNLLTFSQSAPIVNDPAPASTRSEPVVLIPASVSSVAAASLRPNRGQRLMLFIRLGQLYRSTGRYSDSVATFQSTLDKDLARSKTPLVKLLLARAALKRGAYALVDLVLSELESTIGPSSVSKAAPLQAHLRVPHIASSSHSGASSTPEFLEVRIMSMMHQERYSRALTTVVSAISSCSSSSLMQLARLHSLRARILFAIDSSKMQTLSLPKLSPPDGNGFQRNWGLPDLNECIQAYSTSYELYSKVNDAYHAAKMQSGIAQAYLDVLVVIFVILRWPVNALTPWLESNGFDMVSNNFLSRIEIPASHALETFVDCFDVLQLALALLSIAELRAVQAHCLDDQELLLVSINYWKEVRDAFFSLFVCGHEIPTLADASPGYRKRLARIFSRLVRLLLTFDADFIAANTYVLDASLFFQMHLDCGTCTQFQTSSSEKLNPQSTQAPRPPSPTKTKNRFFTGKRFTLGIRAHRPRMTTAQKSLGNSQTDPELDLLPLLPKFTDGEIGCATLLIHVHRNCLSFASNKLLQTEVHDRNKNYICRLQALMDKRRGVNSCESSLSALQWPPS